MIKGLINMKLLIKPRFLLVGLSGFMSMLGFFVPLFYLPNMAQSNGITNTDANFLLSIYGKPIPDYTSTNGFYSKECFLCKKMPCPWKPGISNLLLRGFN